jgi:nicotinate-nucleotide pyrophosphorylase (carboxylating)
MKLLHKSIDNIPDDILVIIHRALVEDIGAGDVTTNSIIPENAMMRGQIIAKQSGVVAGLDIVEATFHWVDERTGFIPLVDEGTAVENRQRLGEVSGRARALLTAERTALNFLGRMSGIASLTHQFVDAVSGTKAVILDTRKTAPGLRLVDKLAVRRGGGENHRFGLFDMILIKDNHIDQIGSMKEALLRVREKNVSLEIEVEARTLADVQTAIEYGITRILLDNMTPALIQQAVELTAGRAKLEASGNVTLENIRPIAETGVDYISIGALTHSVKNFDVSLEWEKSL